jgi:ATP-binding cassette subfamily B protein RaxB
MKIMLGLLKPENGKVLVDDKDIYGIGLNNYRNNIATVMQDDTLLTGSLADNICFFEHDRDEEKIHRCAKYASIHHEIEDMPMGYETLVGDMGAALSGGQIQRILLARALYKNPKILFLDEATSHLDVALESRVNEATQDLNITRIIIAHRPETIKYADRVIELEA